MNEREIFVTALNRTDPSERANYLARACENDAALHLRIQVLLDQHRQLGDFLDGPAVDRPASADPPAIVPVVGTLIGQRYKIRQQIGEGAFGVVYVAQQQQPVERNVALKIIKPGMDSREVIARFDAEKQALALMDHPNVAKVLDAGATDSGHPYFVMELVHGVSITKFCDDQRLSIRERLQLFVDVCRGVHHAHLKGIIHRDLKPSNVMVTVADGRPVPKVIDFGVSKALDCKLTEQTVYTAYGQMIGTPLYMSPEQAEFSMHAVDIRSDIYSLGVLLYELLTGTTPLDHQTLQQRGWDEMRRMIREDEPPPPSARISSLRAALLTTVSDRRRVDPRKLGPSCHGELDWIVTKSLEKDRNRRYESASALAADVQRYLDGEAVQACPPSAWYRFRKLVYRRRAAVAIASVVAVAVLVVVSVAAGMFGWMARDRAARRSATEAQVNLALADARKWQGQEKWTEALSAIRRAEALWAGQESSEPPPGLAQLRRDTEMVLRLQDVMLDLQDRTDDSLGFDFVHTDAQYAAAFEDYGIPVDSLPIEEAAARLHEPKIAPQLIVALDAWAEARRYASLVKARTSGQPWDQLLVIAETVDTDPWRVRMRVALRNRDPEQLYEIARQLPDSGVPPVTLGLLGRALSDLGFHDQAGDLLREAQRRHPASFWLNFDLATVLLRQQPAPLDDAIRFLSVALALQPDCPAVYLHLARALALRGDSAQAIALLRQAERQFTQSPTDLAIKKLAVAYNGLAVALRQRGKLDEALACHERAIELNPQYVNAHCYLGSLLAELERPEEAIACYRQALQLDPHCALAHNNLGVVLRDQKRAEEAVPQLRAAVKLDAANPKFHCNLGNALRDLRRYEEASASYRRAIQLDPNYTKAHCNLGNVLRDLKRPEQASASYRRAIQLDPRYAMAHNNLGNALRDQQQLDEAIACYRQAIQLEANHPHAHANLAFTLQMQGKLTEALESYRRAMAIRPDDAQLRRRYAEAQAQLASGQQQDNN